MLFTSFQFGFFFLVIYVLYLLLSLKWQNRLLLTASYVFYGMWDWRFLSLVCVTTLLDYFCGLRVRSSTDTSRRKLFLLLSVFGNLSILGFFKYFNFFVASFQSLMNYLGISVQPHLLHIILPIGISFYTFRSMSYTADVYRREMEPTTKLIDYALFVAFFPELLAGPIERAKSFLPQIAFPRRVTPDKFFEGCHLIFWGLFQKMFVADNLAKIVDEIFSSAPPYNGIRVLLGYMLLPFKSIATSQAIRISPEVLEGAWALMLSTILTFPTLPQIQGNFGAAGTSVSPVGCTTTFMFLLEVIKKAE